MRGSTTKDAESMPARSKSPMSVGDPSMKYTLDGRDTSWTCPAQVGRPFLEEPLAIAAIHGRRRRAGS